MLTLISMQRLLTAIDRQLRPLARRSGFRLEDVQLLAWLDAFEADQVNVTGSLLADRLGRDRANVQVSLERLEAKGLVASWRGERKERRAWALTARGRSRWVDLRCALVKLESDLFNQQERKTVLEVLETARTRINWLATPKFERVSADELLAMSDVDREDVGSACDDDEVPY